MAVVNDAGTLSQVASIIAGFGATMLTFRVQRHLEELHFESEHSWLPIADWLLVLATTAALVLVIIPLLVFDLGSNLRLPRAACAGSSVLLTGYIFGIMAHYRLIFCGGTKYETHPRVRTTARAEAIITSVAAVAALIAFLIAY